MLRAIVTYNYIKSSCSELDGCNIKSRVNFNSAANGVSHLESNVVKQAYIYHKIGNGIVNILNFTRGIVTPPDFIEVNVGSK